MQKLNILTFQRKVTSFYWFKNVYQKGIMVISIHWFMNKYHKIFKPTIVYIRDIYCFDISIFPWVSSWNLSDT